MPTTAVKRSENIDRDILAVSASDSTVHARAGSRCIAFKARPMRSSPSPESHPSRLPWLLTQVRNVRMTSISIRREIISDEPGPTLSDSSVKKCDRVANQGGTPPSSHFRWISPGSPDNKDRNGPPSK